MPQFRGFDRKQFESLCGMQCSVEDLCGWFRCKVTELDAWCGSEYGEAFEDVYNRLAVAGRVALRREQMMTAKKNASMGAYLDKKLAAKPSTASVKDYRRSRAYRELREAMLLNLKSRDLDDEVYTDKVQEYMDFWVRRQELRDDIARRGLSVTDERGRLMENRSVSLEIQVSRQMLAIFTTLGFKEDALNNGRSEADDEL